jgi:prolyl oligopeptidase
LKDYITFILVLGCLNLNAQDDPYLWLEEVDGENAMEFVNKKSQETFEILSAEEHYHEIFDKSLKIYDSSDNIAYPEIYGDFVYNFWQDKDHVRGIWRRSKKQSHADGNPNWEVLLDLDQMSREDNEKWVFKGVSGLHPTYNLFLVYLSKGGKDATVIKEFDVSKKSFLEKAERSHSTL